MTPKTARSLDTAALPDDPIKLKAIVKDLVEIITDLDSERASLLNRLFGRKSEKLESSDLGSQLTLGFMGASAVPSPPDDGSHFPTPSEFEARSRQGHGRRRLPASLPRRRILQEIGEAERMCPDCRIVATKIGEEISEQIEYVPAELTVLEHVRIKYGCPCCKKFVVTALAPDKPIEKGLAAPGMLSYVVTSKYADHLPLYRLEGILKRSGLEISRSTMSDWVAEVSDLLAPVVSAMAGAVLRGRKLHADDTVLPVIEDEKSGRTRDARIWTIIGDDSQPHTLCLYAEDRSRDGPLDYLKLFEGALHVDADPRYDRVFLESEGRVVEIACWAHARRGFHEAKSSDPIRSLAMIDLIGRLYRVEEEGRDLGAVARKALREERSKPVLADIERYMDAEQPRVLPKSPIAKALQYLRNQWRALNRFVEDGDYDIDNNVAERALRHVVKGRDNWTFAGSDEGGRRAAILFSIVLTCKRHGVDPFAYVRDVIVRVSSHPAKDVADLFPHRWKALRAAEAVAMGAESGATT